MKFVFFLLLSAAQFALGFYAGTHFAVRSIQNALGKAAEDKIKEIAK
jgi:hypothetical protein